MTSPHRKQGNLPRSLAYASSCYRNMRRYLFLGGAPPQNTALLAGSLVLLEILAGCQRSERGATPDAGPATADATNASASAPAGSGDLFTDVTTALGFDVPKEPWPDGKFLTPEIT